MNSSMNEFTPQKLDETIDPLIEERIRKEYGTALVTRIFAVIGLIFLLSVFTIAIVRITISIQ